MEDLNQNELEALRILWEHGPLKPAEIEAAFAWPIENATLRSVLRNLVDEGHLTRRKEGRAFVYRAKASRATMLGRMARRMAQVFAGGSYSELIAQLVKTEKISAEELEELRRIAEGETKTEPKPAKGSGRRVR